MVTLAATPELRAASSGANADEGERPRLRLALFADGALQPRWMVDAFVRIAAAGFADISLIAICPQRKPPLPALWRAARRIDAWLFGATADPSMATDLPAALPDARCITIGGPEAVRAAAWRQAATARLDVVFLFGEADEADEVALADVARYGVWRYCFGTTHDSREELAGWREVAGGAAVTESGLLASARPGASRLIRRSRSRTNRYSVRKNRANLLAKTALFAERELRTLHRLGSGWLQCGTELPAPPAPEAVPGNAEALRALLVTSGRLAYRGAQKLFAIDQWFIAFNFGPPPQDGNLDNFTLLRPPRDRIWADPFALRRDGRHFVFFEEVPFATGKGHIAVIEVHRDGSHSAPVTVLERDYHLSYPFLIEDDGELFMVPESGANRSVDIYRCFRFPDQWIRERVLLDGIACADATLHRAADRWWMFVNIGAEGSELYDELHLFHAPTLHGDWQPHPCNPVVSDACGARPAGRLFERDGKLHRPAQICAPLYGSGVVIAEVLEMSPQAYRERHVARIEPLAGRGILGIHTLNRSGDLNVVDGFARRRRFLEPQHPFAHELQ